MIDIDALDEVEGLMTDDAGNTFFYGHSSADLIGYYPFDIVIGKLDQDGNLDPSFADAGIFRTDFPGYTTCSLTEAIWDTSGIYFIGRGHNHGAIDTNGLLLGKITHEGEIDSSFGLNGFYTQEFLGTYNTAGSLIMDSQGKLVFCGATTQFATFGLEYPMIGRLNQNGEADSTFGTTGIVVWDYIDGIVIDLIDLPIHDERHGDGGYFTEIVEVNDSYICAGYYQGTFYTQAYLGKMHKSGSFSSSFVSLFPFEYDIATGYNHFMKDVQFHDDHVYLAFETGGYDYGTSFTVQKIDTVGNVVDTYAVGESGYYNKIRGLEFYEGQPYVAGYSVDIDNVAPGHLSDDFLMYSLDAEFNPLTPFGTSGFVRHHFPYDAEQGAEDLIYSGGRFVVAGYVNNVTSDNYTDLAFVGISVDPSNDIAEESQPGYMLYPNPSENQIKLLNCNEAFDYEIISSSGSRVLDGTNNSPDEAIDISLLSSGLYILKGQSKSHTFEISFSKR